MPTVFTTTKHYVHPTLYALQQAMPRQSSVNPTSGSWCFIHTFWQGGAEFWEREEGCVSVAM